MALISSFRRGPICIILALAAILACHLDQEIRDETYFDLSKYADTLDDFDSIRIEFLDKDGNPIDSAFRSKVINTSTLAEMPIPHYQGDSLRLNISGWKDKRLVYYMVLEFDGARHQVYSRKAIILPESRLESMLQDTSLTIGDSAPFPEYSILPTSLADPQVEWISLDPQLLAARTGFYVGLGLGSARLKIRLRNDTAKIAMVTVRVVKRPRPGGLDSLRLVPDSLRVAVGGARPVLSVVVYPPSKSSAVAWGIRDANIVSVSPLGEVRGLTPGKSKIWAVSVEDGETGDTSNVEVIDSVPVSQIKFLTRKTDFFLGSSVAIPEIQVYPPEADQGVDLVPEDTAGLKIVGGRLEGRKEGTFNLFAISRSIQTIRDTLRATVRKSSKIASLSLGPDTVLLYSGGKRESLTVMVIPTTASQRARFRISDTSLASVDSMGVIRAVKAGRTYATAISEEDTTRLDSVLVLIKRDMPQLSVGRDTSISVGSLAVFRIAYTQEFGGIVEFKTDLDGDGTYEKTYGDPLTDINGDLRQLFPVEGNFTGRFYMRDSEGNDTVVTRLIKVVTGPVINIIYPLPNSYTNKSIIDVEWSVNELLQSDSLKEILRIEGANSITRTAKDAAGKVFSATITVYLDQTPPAKPTINGPSATRNRTPTWTWSSGGGGSGFFRYRVDTADLVTAPTIKDTGYNPPTSLKEGKHIFYLQERDLAGNWSALASKETFVDTTPPGIPSVTSAKAITNTTRPKWTWGSGGSGSGLYRIKLDDSLFDFGTRDTAALEYTPTLALAEGNHTLYVREFDEAGNISPLGKYFVTVDMTPPSAPFVTSTPNGSRPSWNWSPGTGGARIFRLKIDDSTLSLNAIPTTDTSYSSPGKLADGPHTLYVQEQDAAGNWSDIGRAEVLAFLPPNTLSDKEEAEGFDLLFNGTLPGLNTNFVDYIKNDYSNATAGAAWKVDSAGSLTLPSGIGTDLRSVKTYKDFDFRFDFKVDGNQGIFYRSLLTGNRAWETGVEFAVNNVTNLGKDNPGSAYELFAPSPINYIKYPEDWNRARIVVVGDSVEHWMNGEKIVGYTYHNDRFWVAYNVSKWNAESKLTNVVAGDRTSGVIPEGYLGIQGDHGGKWQIRTIRINSKNPKLGPP